MKSYSKCHFTAVPNLDSRTDCISLKGWCDLWIKKMTLEEAIHQAKESNEQLAEWLKKLNYIEL